MKKNNNYFKMVVTTLFISVSLMILATSCQTVSPKRWETPESTLVEKDYTILGRVTVERKIKKILFINLGGKIGYNELMEEATKKYPDCQEVINLKMDTIGNTIAPDGYIMSGLAIKYKN